MKKKISKQKPWEPIIVSENLTWSEFSRVNLFLHELQGVEPLVSVARLYSHQSTSHVVGYVSQVSAKELRDKEKELAKLERKIAKKRNNLNEKKKVLTKVELAVDPKRQQTTNKNTVLTESEFSKAPKQVRDFVKENKESIVFKPNDGPQTDFLAAGEQDVLYGGAAGGGKSYAMLVDPLRFMHRPSHRALLLRRSMPELRELIDKSRELYTKAFPGAKFREVEKVWKFPSGATLEFGYLDRDADVYRYQGQAYSWIGIDELTQYPTEFPLQYLQSRLRTTDAEIKPYIRCTANPGGVGGHWVRKRYLDPNPPNEAFKGPDGLTRKFIPARLEDNPYLSEDGRYEKMLESLPPIQRKQLLEGNWDVTEGAAFALGFGVQPHHDFGLIEGPGARAGYSLTRCAR